MPRLLPLLLSAFLFLAALSACSGENEAGSSSTALSDIPATGITLAPDASPAEVQTGLIQALDSLGPVRVEATETRDLGGGQVLRSEIVQLIDKDRALARETVERKTEGTDEQASTSDRQEVSVNGLEMVRLYQGQSPLVSRYSRLRKSETGPLPVYGLARPYLVRARAVEAQPRDDGGWDLVLEPRMDAVEAGLSIEQPTVIRFVLSRELLPQEVEIASQSQVGSGSATVGPDGSTVSTEITSIETATTRIEYRFTSMSPLSEAEVALELPENHQVVDVTRQLPLEEPRVEGWPQLWLGREAFGLRLADATHHEFQSGEDGSKQQAAMLVYNKSETEAVPSLMLINLPRAAGEPDDWEERTSPAQEGDSTSNETIGGREATVHMRVVQDPLPAFVISVVFPDAVVELTGYGLGEEQARQALEALRAL